TTARFIPYLLGPSVWSACRSRNTSRPTRARDTKTMRCRERFRVARAKQRLPGRNIPSEKSRVALLAEYPADQLGLDRFAAARVRAGMIDHDHQDIRAARRCVHEAGERTDVVDAAGLQAYAAVHAGRVETIAQRSVGGGERQRRGELRHEW